jgi:hypothetical protein
MKLNVLKLEDILFKNSQGDRVFVQTDAQGKAFIDLSKISSIEGVSEFSILQLRNHTESYLLTEEFTIDATIDDLEEFLEEYDEEDEEESENIDNEYNETLSQEIRSENFDEEEFQLEKKERSQEEESEEEESDSENESKRENEALPEENQEIIFLRKNAIELVSNELNSVEIVEIANPTIEESPIEVFTDHTFQEEEPIEEPESPKEENNEPAISLSSTTSTIGTTVQRIESQLKEESLQREEEASLIVGDLTLLDIKEIPDTVTNITQINNVLSDPTIDEGRDTTQLQNIANTLVRLKSGEELNQTEFSLLGLDNLSSEDVADLNMALANPNSLAVGNEPTTNLQTILDSLNRLDNAESISLTDLSNIGVTGVGGVNQPSIETLNLELNGEENTNEVQRVVDNLTQNSLIRLSEESLITGDLTDLGIIGLEDNADNIAQINNILEDSDVNIGSDIAQLQIIVDVLIKINEKDGDSLASDITQDEWQFIGLNNLSTPDANELNIALGNVNSLDLGNLPLENLQRIGDSLNALDEVKYGNSTGVTLTDLSNIGVIGIDGGGDEPTLEAVNAVLYDNDVSADETNSIQEVVDALYVLNQSDGDSSRGINSLGLETLGIIATDNGYSSDEEEYINYRIDENFIADGDGIYSNDLTELQALVDSVDGRTIHIGETTDDTYTYATNELYDALDGYDTLNITAGTSIDLSAIHDIEVIILNSNNESSDTNFGSEIDRITVKDVLDITDGSNTLVINNNDNDNNSVERVYIDASEFSTDGTIYSDPNGAYHIYTANDASGVSIEIEENIIVE